LQCDGYEGVCPDERIGGKNDAHVMFGENRDGVISVTYKRPLQAKDNGKDKAIPLEYEVSVVGAIGPLNSRKEANAHNSPDKTSGWNCKFSKVLI
jgi:hypothetical protein